MSPAARRTPARRSAASSRGAAKRPTHFVFLDIGGVLIRDPIRLVASALARRESATVDELAQRYRRVSRSLDLGRATLRSAHREFAIRTPYPEYRRLATGPTLRANGPALRAAERLSRQPGVRVLLASNTSRPIFAALGRRFGLARRFPRPVVSFRLGAMKPDPRFFEEMRKRSGASPAFFLDDSRANVLQARTMGFRSRRIRSLPDAARQIRALGQRLRGRPASAGWVAGRPQLARGRAGARSSARAARRT